MNLGDPINTQIKNDLSPPNGFPFRNPAVVHRYYKKPILATSKSPTMTNFSQAKTEIKSANTCVVVQFEGLKTASLAN